MLLKQREQEKETIHFLSLEVFITYPYSEKLLKGKLRIYFNFWEEIIIYS